MSSSDDMDSDGTANGLPSSEMEMLAAEFVLGTLPEADVVAVAARRQREPDLDSTILDWEARLAPLLDTYPSEPPPSGLIAEIERMIADRRPVATTLATLRLQRDRWRTVAAGALGLAAALAFTILLREGGVLRLPAETSSTSFVAMLQKDGTSPAFIVSVDTATRLMTIRPVAAERSADKSYELWLISAQLPAPRSLGVVRDDDRTTSASIAGFASELVSGSTFAVTLEPKGGAPNGSPTGQVLFSGKLVQRDL